MVSKQAIRDNDYNLNIPRYVDSSEDAESWDLHATMLGGMPEKEINQLDSYWQAFPDLRESLFEKASSDYAALKVKTDELKQVITQHNELNTFIQNFKTAFSDFDSYLKTELVTQWQSVKIAQQEAILSQELFSRLQNIDLIDKYQAYQLLDDSWQIIASDLEMLQTEGFAASKQVDPNMMTKKVRGKDSEVQNGWLGRILPFELVQTTHLSEALEALKQKENRLTDISSEYEAILESLSEEEKEAETIKENGDGFINAAVIREAKQLQAEVFEDEAYEAKICRVASLIAEERTLKKAVKTDTEALHLQTKTTIESLNDEQAYKLLERKWISPLLDALNQLPDRVISTLTSKVQKLAEKYATTYADVSKDIHETEQALSEMIDELTGNEFDMQGLKELKSFLQGS